MGHPAADAVQVEEASGVGEFLRGAVVVEAARGWFAEDAVADQVAQHGVQGILVAAGRDGQVGDVVVTFGDEVAAVAGSVWRSDRVVASGG